MKLDKITFIISCLALIISCIHFIPSPVENGKSAYEIAVDHGFVGSESEWLLSLVGKDGQDGKSAYEIVKENNYEKSEEEFIYEVFGVNDQEFMDFTSSLSAPAFYSFVNQNQDTITEIKANKLNNYDKMNELVDAFYEAFHVEENFIIKEVSNQKTIWNQTSKLKYESYIGCYDSIDALAFYIKAYQDISKIKIQLYEEKDGKIIFEDTLDVNIKENEIQKVYIPVSITNNQNINYYLTFECDQLCDTYMGNDILYCEIGHIKKTYTLKNTMNSNYLYVSDYGIYPGNVDSNKMNELLELASSLNTTIQFDNGEYIFNDSLHVQSNTSIVGNTNTILRLSNDAKNKTLMSIGKNVDNVYLNHLYLKGNSEGMPSKLGQETGLKINGALRVNIENVEFIGFDAYGFYATQMSANSTANFHQMLQMSNCRFYDNFYGMVLGPRCEYSQILNCVFGNNYIGCLNQGGNNSYVSCIFNVNHIGFQMDSKNLSNPAHGGCNGCTFNHNGYPIIVNDCEIGWIFNGCQIFYGKLQLNECKGVIFNSSIFGSVKLYSQHSTLKNVNLISNSYFQTDRDQILANNDGSTLVSDCLPYDEEIKEEIKEEEDIASEKVYYTQKATAATGAAENCYLGSLSKIIEANTELDYLDIAIQGSNPSGKTLKGVNVWVGNAETMTISECLVENKDIEVRYSNDLEKYVARIELNKIYDHPVFVVVNSKRENGIGIGYSYSKNESEFLSTERLEIGDSVSANTKYIAEIAVYKLIENK